MDEGLKKRLIGAAVLASLAVIFVPMLFEEPPAKPPALPPLPERPPERDFASEMLREEMPAITPLAPPVQSDEVAPAENITPRPSAKPLTGISAWVVQVGSFSSRDNAEQLVEKLRAAQLPTPDPELVDIRGKRYFRVKVGPVIERTEADRLLDKVSSVVGTTAQVRAYP
jgi:DedD protein